MATGHWLNVRCLVNIWIGKRSNVCALSRQKSGLTNTAALCWIRFSESRFFLFRASRRIFDRLCLSLHCISVNMLELYSCFGAPCLSSFGLFFFFLNIRGATFLRKFINSHWTQSTARLSLAFCWNFVVKRPVCCVFSCAASMCLPCSAQTPSAVTPGGVGLHQSWGKKMSWKTREASVSNGIRFGSSMYVHVH